MFIVCLHLKIFKFEYGEIFIVPHRPWGGASVFVEGSLSCHTCREVEPRFLRRDLYRATQAVGWSLGFCGGIFIVPHRPTGHSNIKVLPPLSETYYAVDNVYLVKKKRKKVTIRWPWIYDFNRQKYMFFDSVWAYLIFHSPTKTFFFS